MEMVFRNRQEDYNTTPPISQAAKDRLWFDISSAGEVFFFTFQMKSPFLFLLFAVYGIVAVPPDTPEVAGADCEGKCGDVDIKFPFGMGPDQCFLDEWFEIVCINETTPRLKKLNLEVTGTSLRKGSSYSVYDREDGKPTDAIVVKSPIMYSDCMGWKTSNSTFNLTGSPFFFSSSNWLVAVGCPYQAVLATPDFGIVDCYARCSNDSRMENGYCDGINCCRINMPHDSRDSSSSQAFEFDLKRERGDQVGEHDCRYAFLAHDGWLMQTSKLDVDLPVREMQFVPVSLDWYLDEAAIMKLGLNITSGYSSSDLQPYSCIRRIPNQNIKTNYYSCFCNAGYYNGNAYLKQCDDIDECQDSRFNISCLDGSCNNTRGSYECIAHYQTHSFIRPIALPGRINAIKVVAGGIGGVVLLLVVLWLHKFIKKRRELKLKQKNFKRNGGLLLEKQLHSAGQGDYIEKSKLFNSYDLEKATDNFSKNRILGKGGQGTVYKGMLEDGRIVAVKKSITIDEGRVEQFINEVIILSEINHRNVVKLLGCCLETEVPLLVYEFIPNGTLYQYLHDPDENLLVSWEMRLQIAVEVAGAISYLHSASSIPIYHRDIKSNNILLDEKYRAKVADFGASKVLSIDQTHVTTIVAGTLGYLDPEYFRSSQLTDKSDVYSFGVVLVELLTGQKPVSVLRPVEHRGLVAYFISVMEEDQLFHIVDARVLLVQDTVGREQIAAVAQLAKRCLNMIGRRRPTMKEVAVELERIRMHGRRDGDVEYQRTESTILSWDGDVSMFNIDDAMTINSNAHTYPKIEETSDAHPLLGVVTM
ncbi:hypothetical protein CDL15_Pgr001305 [Punica granatum]|uniref:Protein kinase domain-containing protein n=2 Tax=Punica granatum TaxID=22663 RepID=A0A218WLR2_PUNGR|nr:hypothetical protein CDL15_Pgr001305 [Punica granatum]